MILGPFSNANASAASEFLTTLLVFVDLHAIEEILLSFLYKRII